MPNIEKAKGQLPAHLKQLAATAQDASDDLSGGVQAGFPIISFRGKVWRIRQGGEEKVFENADGDPSASIQAVMVGANPRLSKIYYKKKYEEGDNEQPDCFSVDGVKPDPSATNKQSKTCAACPHNAWGSRISESGKKTKACSDARRVAVAFPNDLAENGSEAHVALLRVPAASLGNLKMFGEALGKKGLKYFMVVAKISFDKGASYPHLEFKPTRLLTDEEAEAVLALRGDEDSRMETVLSTATEYAETDDTEDDDDDDDIGTPEPAGDLDLGGDDDDDDDDDGDGGLDLEDDEPPQPKKKVTRVGKKKASKKKASKKKAPAKKADDDDDDDDDAEEGDSDLESELDKMLSDL